MSEKTPRLRPHELTTWEQARMTKLGQLGVAMYHPPFNPHVREYENRLATHHIELRDPNNPPAGNILVPNETEIPGGVGWPE